MKIVKFYAVKIKNNTELDRVEIGTARVDPDNVTVSASKYDQLKRTAQKLMSAPGRAEYIRLVTEDGREDTFGGYLATGFLHYVKFDFKDTFPGELRAFIRQSGLSQRAFAEALGVPLRTLEDWLAGKKKPDTFKKEAVLNKASQIANEK